MNFIIWFNDGTFRFLTTFDKINKFIQTYFQDFNIIIRIIIKQIELSDIDFLIDINDGIQIKL